MSDAVVVTVCGPREDLREVPSRQIHRQLPLVSDLGEELAPAG
jgi:hypothetical protein